MPTVMAKMDGIDRKWYVIDAEGQVLGRLASRVAVILRGKRKPSFAHHLVVGDHVVVINAGKAPDRPQAHGQDVPLVPGVYRGLREARREDDQGTPERATSGRGDVPGGGRRVIKKSRYRGSRSASAQKPEPLLKSGRTSS